MKHWTTLQNLWREVVEKEEMMKDKGELRMFNLFAEAVEDLYTGMVDKFVRKTPALWEEFAICNFNRCILPSRS